MLAQIHNKKRASTGSIKPTKARKYGVFGVAREKRHCIKDGVFIEMIKLRLIQFDFLFLPEIKKGANLGKGRKIKRYKKSPALAA